MRSEAATTVRRTVSGRRIAARSSPADVRQFGHGINKDGVLGTHRRQPRLSHPTIGRGRVVSRFIASHNKVICGRTSKHLSAGSSTVGFVVAIAANRIVWMITVLSLSLSGGVCMVRFRVHTIVQFCADTRALYDRRYRSTSPERLPVLFDAARRRNAPGFRLWRPTPAAVVSRSLQVQGRTCTAWMS